jgi:hypothetical protein
MMNSAKGESMPQIRKKFRRINGQIINYYFLISMNFNHLITRLLIFRERRLLSGDLTMDPDALQQAEAE